MAEINVIEAIKVLDHVLFEKKKSYTLYTCGGAALIFLGFDDRRTGDIDLIVTEIDEDLSQAAQEVADRLGISSEWLNNKVAPLEERLPKGWKKFCSPIFSGKALILMSISRQDLINSKLHAAIERRAQDYKDLVWLKPTSQELQIAQEYTLKQGTTETYEMYVNYYIKELKNDLKIS